MLVKIVGIAIGVFAVLVVILALEGLVAGEWTTTARQVAPYMILLMFFAIVVAGIYDRKK